MVGRVEGSGGVIGEMERGGLAEARDAGMFGAMAGTNRELAQTAVAWARAHGVREVVLCAGARNLALVGAWEEAGQEDESLRIWNAFEERCAGFFALGRMQAGSGPVAVVVTSGTAAAELLPAAVEGFYQGLPLLLMTADRPRRFRGTAAPQAIEQAGLFGFYAPLAGDVEPGEAAGQWSWVVSIPAQLNLCFEEADAGEHAECRVSGESGILPPTRVIEKAGGNGADEQWVRSAAETGRLWVVVGKLEREETEAVAAWLARGGFPVWLESTSQLWGRPELENLWIRHGESAMQEASHVLRLGGVPNARFWRDLESRPEIGVCSLSRQGFRGLGREAEHFPFNLSALTAWAAPPAVDPGFAARCRERDQRNQPGPAAGEPGFVATLSAEIPDGSTVFLGNSLPIRHWQDVAVWRTGLRIFANRGANGIDGEGSSFLGVAEGAPQAWTLLGDLTALYDLAAPWMQEQMTTRRLRWVILNNHGGGIFEKLPQVRGAPERVRDRILNRHQLDFSAWAGMWGMAYQAWHDPADPAAVAAAAAHDGPVVIECFAGSR